MEKKFQIAILSRGPSLYSTRSLYLAGVNRGHRMKVVDHMRCNLVVETDKPVVLYYGNRFEGMSAIIPRIGASVTAHGAAVIRQFEVMDIYSTLSSKALLMARNKFSCLQVLSAHGIGVPKTLLPTSNTMAFHLLDHLKGPPYVIKMARGTHGMGVLKASSKSEAIQLIQGLQPLKGMIVLQEYIEESSGRDIRLIVVGGEVVATMERQSQAGEFRSNLHLGGSSRPIEPTVEERETAIRAAHLMGLEVAGVDLLQSRRGPLVLEVNASPGLEGIEKTTGVDISSKIIRLIEKKLHP